MSVFNSPFNQVFPNPFGSPFNGDASSGTTWTPAEWFLASEQGAWYDPSDMSTLFQDAAGTIPVTAVGQPVGRILDKSGRGNHASQATAASRPVLSARKNKLLATTTLATQSVTLTASPHTLSFNGTGTVTLTGASTAGPLVGTGAGNRVSLTFTPTAGSVTFTVSGSVTEAQLEDGSAFTTYQRVTTASDYDTVGFPLYLKFDGVDDFLVTGSIDFTGTDKMTVVAGVRKLASAEGVIAELSVQYNLNNGSFGLQSRADPTGVTLFVRGSASTVAVGNSAFTTNTPAVITATSQIAAGWLHTISVNAGTPATAATNVGTGNFGNYPLYIGRRGGTSLPFNGNLYQLVIRGALTADLAPIEAFTADKTGVTLP